MTHCKEKGCTNLPPLSKGWCKPHYDAWRRTGQPGTYRGDRSHLSLWERIQEVGFVRTKDGCLEYRGYRNQNGYGQFRPGHSGRLERVHRIAYKEFVGELLDNEVVLHICDNPPCSEPSHLRKGTPAENIKDMWLKGRASLSNSRTCPNGHPYPVTRPRAIDKNRCRICANERNKRYRLKKKQRLV